MNRDWVISDIHGCLNTLRSLIETLVIPTRQDTLYFVGDYIDRGPDSKGVMDYVMDLQAQGFSVVALKGNHEDFMVKAFEEEKQLKSFLFFKRASVTKQLWMKHGGREALNSFKVNTITEIPELYIDWINQRPFYHELDKFLIVHAGLNFELDDPLEDEHAMLWVRDYHIEPAKINQRKLIHGHVPVSLDFIDLTINSGNYSFIDIDNGCYMNNKSGYGNLIALELNTMELKVQPNVDMQ